jgi:5'-methylthioinosine phosphorylase
MSGKQRSWCNEEMAGMMSSTTNTTIVLVASFFTIPTPVSATVTTPYGTALFHTISDVMVVAPAPARARLYALKDMGYERCIELLPLWATNRLLSVGDIVLPHDVVDLTRTAEHTFFANKGYGFVHHNPPHCPVLREALLQTARQIADQVAPPLRPRIFQRGVYAAVDTIQAVRTLRAQLAAQWNVDAIGEGGAPTSFLARELELCYAPLGVVVAANASTAGSELDKTVPKEYGADSMLAHIVAQGTRLLPPARTCGCPTTMQAARDQGLIGDDWHTWVT